MKQAILFSIVLFFSVLTLTAQNYSPCYNNNMSEGNAAFAYGEYSKARTCYMKARQCAGGNPAEAQKKISACDAKIKAQNAGYVSVDPPKEDAPFRFMEKMPEFPGGPEALNAFLTKETHYPENARNKGINGSVLVEFIVEEDGSISNAKLLVSLQPDCDKEAVRVIMSMPKWNPGKNGGKPVRAYYTVPVRFSL